MFDPDRIAAEHVELDVLKTNLAAGTCVGEPASEAQQDLRRREIGELSAALGEELA